MTPLKSSATTIILSAAPILDELESWVVVLEAGIVEVEVVEYEDWNFEKIGSSEAARTSRVLVGAKQAQVITFTDTRE